MFCKVDIRLAKTPKMALKIQYDMVEEIINGFKDHTQMEDILSCFYSIILGKMENK